MNSTTFDKQSFIKNLGTSGIIAVAACLLLVLSAFPTFAHLFIGFDRGIHMSDFEFPSFKSMFIALVEVAPAGLFAVYLVFFREKSNLSILFPIVFFTLAFYATFELFNIVYYISEGYYSAVNESLGVFKILALCGIVAFSVITGIFLMKGRINKTFILLILIFGGVCVFIQFISFCKNLEHYFRYDLVSMGKATMNIVGNAGFYFSLFMFASAYNVPYRVAEPVYNTGYNPVTPNINPNYAPPVTPNINPNYAPPVTPNINPNYAPPVTPNINPGYASPVTPNVNPQPTAMSTQERLAFLKEQLDRGIITKEVYDAQVAEAIAQL